MSEWKLKRFWSDVTVEPEADGYAIKLDGRAIKTPAKMPLIVPTRAIADRIAEEWRAVEEQIDPALMPFTRSANAAIDKVALQFDEVAALIAEYAETDLLCYRAESPAALAERQAAAWDPLLTWADAELGLSLKAQAGVMPHAQAPSVLPRAKELIGQMNAFELTAFHDLVGMSGSFVLGMVAAKGRDLPENVWKTARIDEIWQEELWGADEDATEVAEIKQGQFRHACDFWQAAQAK